jgi:hypothetical protein
MAKFVLLHAKRKMQIAQSSSPDAQQPDNLERGKLEDPGSEPLVSQEIAIALRNIAIAQAQAGDPIAVLDTVQRIEDSSIKAGVLKKIAIAQAEAGDLTAAQTTLMNLQTTLMNIALAIAQQIQDSSKWVYMYSLRDIAIAQAQAGDPTAAQTNLNIALALTERMQDSSEKAHTLTNIAIALVKVKSGNQAVAIAEKILIDRNKHLLEIAVALVEMDVATA